MDKAAIEERFRRNVVRIIQDRGLSEAAVSIKAGLNRRFVTDLREGRAQSPKMSNAYALAEVLGLDVRDIIAGRDRPAVNDELLELLGGYKADEQARILAAIRALLPKP